jgi:hypothetical protein
MDRWAHLGHTLGECWYTAGMTYIHIPKNASSFVKGCLINNGWQHSNAFVESEKYIVVLRDPLDRWLSGMAQYQVNSNQLDLDVHTIFNTITFDDHTETQYYFLKHIQTAPTVENTTFFKFGPDLRKNLNKFMLSNGYAKGVEGIPNINARDNVKQELMNRLQQFMDIHPEFKTCVQDHFAVDYNLYENVKFYD